MANLTPQSLNRHGITDDVGHQTAKQSMDAIHRHVLQVKDLRDAFRQADAGSGPALANDYGGYASEYGFANGDGYDFLGDTVALAADAAAARLAEDSQPLARRSEDRLHVALGRISRGTFTPTAAERALGFAAEAEPYEDDDSPFSCTCEASISPHHVVGYSAVWTPDDAAELAAQGCTGPPRA